MRIQSASPPRPRAGPAGLGMAVLLALGGCSPPQEPPQEFPAASARGLEPSGLIVVGYPDGRMTPEDWDGAEPWGQIVADGAGQVWMTSAWGVTRLDARSGESMTWDAADDAAFGSIDALAPTAGTGVWLLDRDRVRLFDGQRFTVDLQVPAEVLTSGGTPGTVGHVHDLAEAGSALWLSVHDVVFPGAEPGRSLARWSDGTWTVMAESESGVSGYLEADVEGLVWAGGWLASEGPPDGSTLGRWDGTAWSLPGAGSERVRGMEGDVVADPTGGAWLLSTPGEGGEAARLLRFDGSAWSPVGPEMVSSVLGYEDWWVPGLSVEPGGEGGPGTVMEGAAIPAPRAAWLAVSALGDAWLAGQGGVARFSADGSTRMFGLEEFIAPIRGVAAAGRDLVVADLAGVLRWDGDRFTRVWQDPEIDDVWVETMAAVSADEVWLTGPEDSVDGDPSLFRHRGDAWELLGLADPAGSCYYTSNGPEDGSGPAAVVATDGGVWSGMAEGLTRFDGAEPTVVGPVLQRCVEFPGPGGGVWTRGDQFVVHLADGTTEPVPVPSTGVCRWAGGPDGTVVVSSPANDPVDDESCDQIPSTLLRWDGTSWAQIDPPGPKAPVAALLVTDDGAAWVVSSGSGRVSLSRYADGRWTVPSPDAAYPLAIRAATAGRVCTLDNALLELFAGESIGCFDRTGEIARFDLSGMGVSDFSIAPDGAVWVAGPQVARLPGTVPEG